MAVLNLLPANLSISVQEGKTLLESLRQAKIPMDAPCGGRGKCGKCRVCLLQEDGSWISVSACQHTVTGDLTVLLSGEQSEPAGISYSEKPPYIGGRKLAAAADLGTTTIAVYLSDPADGRTLAVRSSKNPQISYGADVVSRMDYALHHDPAPLRDALRSELDRLLGLCAGDAGVSLSEIRTVTLAGNTCMHHLIAGLSLESLSRPPFTPAVQGLIRMPAREFGLNIHPEGIVTLLPCIGGFVGADTSALLLTCTPAANTTIVLDIGTNAEIALIDSGHISVCSAAAGPALEGARIRCGMRAEPGAIAGVRLSGSDLTLRTVEGLPPAGICGSGLLDAAAALLDAGILASDGRLRDADECDAPLFRRLARRLCEIDGERAFVLASELETGGNAVFLTQTDIRELQLAKAAVSAAADCLLSSAGLSREDVSKVLLAGAFGSLLNPDSACRIGLLPKDWRGRVQSIGNAAGEGAVLVSLDPSLAEKSAQFARDSAYLELSGDPLFEAQFLAELDFPANDLP